ncbi:MAG: rhodanese-like domain-containing protein [Chloroflexota bacterium]
MLLKYFYDKELAQASYMVGCSATGEALIIDPSRDVQPYLDAASDEGLAITHVTETHIHADYVSGTRELASQTGATIYLSDMGDADWKYGFADEGIRLHDGDVFMVGNIKVEVLHTSGHTPESISFIITDTATADQPMGIFTGDFLFVGNIGRPDLLEESAGIMGTRELGARQQFANVQRFKDLPDYLQIFPGHGAGSACGKGLGSIPSTTLGYEKLFNPAFQIDDEDTFVEWLLDGQPEAPKYFAQMKKVNKIGPTLLKELEQPKVLSADDFQNLLALGAQIIDIRSSSIVANSFVEGTLHIPASSQKFSTYVGWFLDYDQPLYLISTADRIQDDVRRLRAIGADNIAGYLPAELVDSTATIPQLTPEQVQNQMHKPNLFVIDVRGQSEHHDARIAGTVNYPMGFIKRYVDDLPHNTPIITQCASGTRSQIVASWLKSHNFTNVSNLSGGIQGWQRANLPTITGAPVKVR